MMKMTFVKDMVNNLNDQLGSVESVAASSQEISASIIEIAGNVANNAQSARNSVDVTEKGANELRNSVNLINEAFTLTESAKEKVEDVTEKVSGINEMVGVIQAVAEQTNLLALNASIEAARAGEAGRGFAVVADEIRKLAENTSESVTTIQGYVNDLNGSVGQSVNAIKDASISFNNGLKSIHEASESVEVSKNEVVNILEGMEKVSEHLEEQTATSEEVAAAVAFINENSKDLFSITNKTGRAFNEIAVEINKIRLNSVSQSNNLTTRAMLELTITDHLNWKWMLINMLLGYKTMAESDLGTHHQCRLGKWIDEVGRKKPEFKSIIAKLDGPHEQLHSVAAKSVRAYNQGYSDLAETFLPEIDQISDVIVKEINNMIEIEMNAHKGKRSKFEWNKKLTVYNHFIDEQHKKLLNLGKNLETFGKSSNKKREDFKAIVAELVDYTITHFTAEEGLLEKVNYPNLENHKKVHQRFVDKISSLDVDKFDYNDAAVLDELVNFLASWVIKHISHEDYKYSKYLQD
jgi:methyl-accepting chemotaxis protein